MKRKINLDLDKLKDFYNQGLSITKMSEEFDVSYITIKRYLKKLGLTFKNKSISANNSVRICKICGENDPTLFPKNKTKLCKKCDYKRTNEYMKQRRLKFLELKGNRCFKCGYDRYQGALEFHHINPEEKEVLDTQTVTSRKISDIMKELDKCVILCANCHREVHGNVLQI